MSVPQSTAVGTRPDRRRPLWLFGLGLVAVALVVGLVWWLADRGTAGRDAAVANARNGQFTDAEPALRAAFERNPNDGEVVELLARGYLEADDITRTEEFLTHWIRLRPDQIEPVKLRNEFYRKHKEVEKANADAKRLVELDPGNFEFRRMSMAQAFEAGHFEQAEVDCRECLKLKPGDFGSRSMLSQILRARGDPIGAAKVLDELLVAQPKNTQFMLARAILYQENGAPEKAIPMLREVLQSDPRRQRTAGYQLSLALEQVGDTEGAKKVMVEVRRRQDIEIFSDAMKNQPDNLDLQVRFAISLLADGHDADGEALLRSVLGRDPRFRPAHAALADYYEKKGEANRAAEHRRIAGQP